MNSQLADDKRHSLGDELTELERSEKVAEEELGTVVLDGGDAEATQGRLDMMRSRIDHIRRALSELGGREEAHAKREAEAVKAANRSAFYRHEAEYVRRLAPVIESRERLDDAEKHLSALGAPPEGSRSLFGDASPWDGLEGEVRTAARGLPRQFTGPEPGSDPTRSTKRPHGGRGVVVEHMQGEDRFDRLAAELDLLAEREAENTDAEKLVRAVEAAGLQMAGT